jgi:diaminopimelate epimerase
VPEARGVLKATVRPYNPALFQIVHRPFPGNIMRLPFTKMHGLGNDFVVVQDDAGLTAERIRAMADRHTGIGFDQLLALAPPRAGDTDAFYRIFNADGGEVEQCGNGARCIARYLAAANANPDHIWRLDSPGGRVNGQVHADGSVSVTMGEPDFDPASLPFDAAGLAASGDGFVLPLGSENIEMAVVSMGNPHAVIEVDSVADASVARLGPLLERHERFPKRANIGFMQVVAPDRIKLRVYERGVGETSACGTGACAAVAAGRRSGRLAETVRVELPGGELQVSWKGPGEPVWLTGEAVTAFEGVIEV